MSRHRHHSSIIHISTTLYLPLSGESSTTNTHTASTHERLKILDGIKEMRIAPSLAEMARFIPSISSPFDDQQPLFILRKSSLIGLWLATFLYGIYVILFAACIYIFWTKTKLHSPAPPSPRHFTPAQHLSPPLSSPYPKSKPSSSCSSLSSPSNRLSHYSQSFIPVNPRPAVNLPLQISAVFMFGLSTAHMILDIITTLGMDTVTGVYVRPTAVAGVYLHLTNSAIADSVIIYRCYIVWGFNKYFILPIILVLTTTVYGYTMGLSVGTISISLATNIIVTGLTAGRLWWGGRQTARVLGKSHTDKYGRATAIVLESGAIYSLSLLVFLVLSRLELGTRRSVPPNTYACELPWSYVVYLVVSQLVGIIPTLIIVRVGLNLHPSNPHESSGSTSSPSAVSISRVGSMARMTGARLNDLTLHSTPEPPSLSHPPLAPMSIAFTTEVTTFRDAVRKNGIGNEIEHENKSEVN